MNQVVNGLVGVPYKLGGTDPATGLDCWTLVLAVYRAAGLPVPPSWDATGLSRAAIARTIRSEASAGWARKVYEPMLFDLVADTKRAHVGLWLGDDLILHADREMGVCVWRRDRWMAIYPDTEFFACR